MHMHFLFSPNPIIIIVVVYFRLVVHRDVIIDTRAQKKVSHTVAHYRIGFARDQH